MLIWHMAKCIHYSEGTQLHSAVNMEAEDWGKTSRTELLLISEDWKSLSQFIIARSLRFHESIIEILLIWINHLYQSVPPHPSHWYCFVSDHIHSVPDLTNLKSFSASYYKNTSWIIHLQVSVSQHTCCFYPSTEIIQALNFFLTDEGKSMVTSNQSTVAQRQSPVNDNPPKDKVCSSFFTF